MIRLESSASYQPGTRSSGSVDNILLRELYEATDAQDLGKVKSILDRNLDVNQCIESWGMTVLHLAVGTESIDIVKLLLEHHADPNAKAGDDGLSSLHLSINFQNVDIFKLLFNAGGDPKLGDRNGISCMELLEDMDADVKESFLEAMVQNDESSMRYLTTDVNKSPIPSRPNQISADVYQSRTVPSTAPHTLRSPPASSISTSGNSTFYSCVSSNTGKDNDGGPQLESISASLSSCIISNNPRKRFSSPFSLSSAGISDQTTNAFISDVTFSIWDPPATEPTNLTTPPLSTVNENPSDSDYDTSQSSSITTGAHCTSSAECSCCSSVAPTPVLTEKQMNTLRATAAAHGLPVLPSTISVLSKFVNTETNTVILSPPKTSSTHGYSMELDHLLRNIDLIHQWQTHQVDFVQNFMTPKKTSKSFYNYVLLDPYVLQRTNFSGNNLRTGLLQNSEKFHAFLKAIFYVGKGSANRPLQHLVEAKERWMTKARRRLPDNSKLDKVVSIWEKGQGVFVLSLFHHSAELEANAYEAAMIDSIGLGCSHLTNMRKGSYLNTPATNWSQKTKNQFGAYLLHKAYCSYVVSGGKSFYPNDV